MYKIQCECGKQLSVAFGQVNMQGRCPSCARTFIIPAPPELTTGKLKCRCGLVMEYDYQDAGSLCQCSQCNALFKIPGGTAESMSSQLEMELDAKRAQVRKSVTQEEFVPQNPVFESLGEFHQTPKPIVRADYESFGFGKMLVGVGILFLACVSVTALAVWAQGKWKLPNNWAPWEIANNTKPNEASPENADPATSDIALKQEEPIAQPRIPVGPFDSQETFRWVRIGEIPPSVSPRIPAELNSPLTATPLTDNETVLIADKIVAAINNNSSKDLIALMDAEVIGNYLFQHAELPAEKRFQLGSEALELYGNHDRLSEQLPDAQAFPPIRMGKLSVPLIRVCSNTYQGPQSLDPIMGFGPMGSGTTTSGISKPKRASDDLIEEYDRARMVIHNQLPIRFRRIKFEERSKDLRFQRTPLNMLLDHPAMYFAVITTRNRAGKPVLLDLACINFDHCLLELTWNSIDENTQEKSFRCSRPPNQTEKYIKEFRESVGDKTMNDIFKSNFAFKQVRIAKNEVCVVTGYLEESQMPQPSADDCLDALEDLERLFPDDKHNVMLQYVTSRDAKFANEANQLFDRLVKLKYSNVTFFDEGIGPYRWIEDVGMAKKIVDALKSNCLR